MPRPASPTPAVRAPATRRLRLARERTHRIDELLGWQDLFYVKWNEAGYNGQLDGGNIHTRTSTHTGTHSRGDLFSGAASANKGRAARAKPASTRKAVEKPSQSRLIVGSLWRTV